MMLTMTVHTSLSIKIIVPEKVSNLHLSRKDSSLRLAGSTTSSHLPACSFMPLVFCCNYLPPNDWTPLPVHLSVSHISAWLQTMWLGMADQILWNTTETPGGIAHIKKKRRLGWIRSGGAWHKTLGTSCLLAMLHCLYCILIWCILDILQPL